jgi:SAM-dependent methyltransferase
MSLSGRDPPGARLASGRPEPALIQRRVTAWYEGHAQDWRAIYRRTSVSSRVRQERLARALRWVDGLPLPAGGRALDVGSGAGIAALALAGRGLAVTAVDPAWAMLRLTRRQEATAGPGRRLGLVRGDGHALGLAAGCADLVLALGVIPYLHTPGRALDELRRVLAPGGWLIVSAHNPLGLTDLVDPRLTPLLRAPRRAARRLLEAAGLAGRDTGVRYFAPGLGAFDRLLAGHGLAVVRGESFGFGPFTLLGRQVLPRRWAVALHDRLQALAARGAPGLARAGIEYLVLARKPAAG